MTDTAKATIVANYEGDTLTIGSVSIIQNEVRTNNSNDNLQLGAAGTGTVIINDGVVVDNNEIRAARSNDDLVLAGAGSGVVNIATAEITKKQLQKNQGKSVCIHPNI